MQFYLCDDDGLARAFVDDVPVLLSVDGALVEVHDVLREGSGLVREDVLDLTQLLVEGRGSSLGRRVVVRVIHLLVPVDQQTVEEANHFHAVTRQRIGC